MKAAGLIVSVLIVLVQATRRTRKLLDLTHPFDESTLQYPGLKPFDLEITNRNVTKAGFWLQTENYAGATHVGTHIDAPCHIVKGQWNLEQIPLNYFIAPGAVVDISQRARIDRDANLEVHDLINWENLTKQSLNRTIVLVNSGWSKKWSNKEEFLGTDTDDVSQLHFPGVSPEAAEWLATNRKIYGLGIDTTSLDNGQAVQRKAHEALFRSNIYGMENVANLHKLPRRVSVVYVFPMRIREACGSPLRIMARL